jgi:hypothetical protein
MIPEQPRQRICLPAISGLAELRAPHAGQVTGIPWLGASAA